MLADRAYDTDDRMIMIICKICSNKEIVKNGKVRNKQRYRCETCDCNFVEGDERVKYEMPVKHAFAIISYGSIAKPLDFARACLLHLTKCGTLPSQKKQKMDYKSIRSWHKKNHYLGCWQS